MSSSAASNQSQTITNIAFGIAATIISIIIVWQGRRAWRLWQELGCRQQTAFPDIELGSSPPVQACTSHEEPVDEHPQGTISCGTSTPKASNPGSDVSHSRKDVRPLEIVAPLDLLATEPWEEVAKLSECFPSPFSRSSASSRSEIELRMPPKPTLLRNSRSLEAVPHFSLY